MAYRNPALTVDALVLKKLNGRFQVLLIQRGKEPFKGCWAFPGGFVDYGEDPKHAVVRELEEETHLKTKEQPRLVSVRGDPNRDPRQHIVTVAYAVKIKSCEGLKGDDDAKDAKWFDLDAMNNIHLAFDHAELANELRSWLREDRMSGEKQGVFFVS